MSDSGSNDEGANDEGEHHDAAGPGEASGSDGGSDDGSSSGESDGEEGEEEYWSSSEDERMENTVGDVPMEWYANEDHIGYDREGNKIMVRGQPVPGLAPPGIRACRSDARCRRSRLRNSASSSQKTASTPSSGARARRAAHLGPLWSESCG